ncbi:MAG: hypothetical protein O2887_16045 [Bacteroidetes bacterium]|nr:hypothetical protein [Bacteroidota bacterium]
MKKLINSIKRFEKQLEELENKKELKNEDEWDTYSDLPSPKAYEKREIR